VIAARFDDLLPGSERSFRLIDPLGELVAVAPREVPAVLGAAEAAAEDGRWVAGFVCYEAAAGLDRSLAVRGGGGGAGHARGGGDPFADLPLAWFGVFDGREPIEPPAPSSTRERPAWTPSVGRGRYAETVERIRELIAGGETYQVNHTIRMRTDLPRGIDLGRLYADLVLAQRGRYGARLAAGRFAVLSASPELFFSWRGDRLTTRPMKGTAGRGRWLEEDEAAAERLRASTKDRAENAMIVDLLRNDLGRIAVPGTVVADPLFEVERYETVWQMTSTVSAEVPVRTSLVDVFRALFPSGSVTGAPKVASMRAIAGLEDSPRGVYTGAVGFLSPRGAPRDADRAVGDGREEPRAVFSVAIRTIQVDARSGAAEYGVGAGITFGSSGDAEYDEVEAKARVLIERRSAFELLETLAWGPGDGYRHLDEHLGRLERSARYFGFAFDPGRVGEELEKTAADASEPLRVRLRLARDGGIEVDAAPLPDREPGDVRLAIASEVRVDPREVWPYHKTTAREPYDRRRAMRPDVDDVLLVNTDGRVTESTVANLAVRIDGEWWTPPVVDGLLAGTYRAVLLREGSIAERSVSLDEVRDADEIALISSVRGWRRAVLVG
jgi:para-aminobenzoate synthetase/4-amino-4-deoxychorismate lyase